MSENIVKKVCKEVSEFDKWNIIKKETHLNDNLVGYKEREIFWLRLGKNIGSEEFGKGNAFQRPVIIIKKLTKDLFFGVPLSSKIKNGSYFYTFEYKDKKGKVHKNTAMILQLKAFDKKRLMGRIGTMPKDDFENMIEKIRELFIPLN